MSSKQTPPKLGDLRVYHIPQIPSPAFYVSVSSPHEAKKIMDVLANYDIFQLENNIKLDYSNANGLEVYEADESGDSDWCEWYSEDGFDLDEWIAENQESEPI